MHLKWEKMEVLKISQTPYGKDRDITVRMDNASPHVGCGALD